MKSERKKVARRATSGDAVSKRLAATEFNKIFSHSGALAVAKIANREIDAAKARLRKLGIDPEDPSSKEEDLQFKLS